MWLCIGNEDWRGGQESGKGISGGSSGVRVVV